MAPDMAMNAATQFRQTPRSMRGFTLMELMIVVAVAIILASVGIPSMRSFMASQRIKTTSFDLIAMLTITRSEAIKRNAQVTATPVGNDWSQGWAVTGPAPVAATCLPGSTLSTCTAGTLTISQQSAIHASDITVTCLVGGTVQTCQPIIYNPSGRLLAGSQAQSIQIVSSSLPSTPPGANARCIWVDMSGRPMSKKGNCS